MPMPKGYKSKFGYASVTTGGGKTYREISDIMTESGDKINHSTARNIFLGAMTKIAKKMTQDYDGVDSAEIAEDPRFQEAVQELMIDIC